MEENIMNLKELLEQETTTKPEITTKVKVCRKKNNDGVYPLKAKCEFSFYVENPDITPDNLLEVIHFLTAKILRQSE